MRYFLDYEEVTLEELETERKKWEYNGAEGWGHGVIVYVGIDEDGDMLFSREEYEC